MKRVNPAAPTAYHIIQEMQPPTPIIVLHSPHLREDPTPPTKQLGFVITGLIMSTLNIIGQIIMLSFCIETFTEYPDAILPIVLMLTNIWAIGNGVLTWVTAFDSTIFTLTKTYMFITSIISALPPLAFLIFGIYNMNKTIGWDGLAYLMLVAVAALDLLIQEANYICALFFYTSTPQYYIKY